MTCPLNPSAPVKIGYVFEDSGDEDQDNATIVTVESISDDGTVVAKVKDGEDITYGYEYARRKVESYDNGSGK